VGAAAKLTRQPIGRPARSRATRWTAWLGAAVVAAAALTVVTAPAALAVVRPFVATDIANVQPDGTIPTSGTASAAGTQRTLSSTGR
jgi:hypothetical protein